MTTPKTQHDVTNMSVFPPVLDRGNILEWLTNNSVHKCTACQTSSQTNLIYEDTESTVIYKLLYFYLLFCSRILTVSAA